MTEIIPPICESAPEILPQEVAPPETPENDRSEPKNAPDKPEPKNYKTMAPEAEVSKPSELADVRAYMGAPPPEQKQHSVHHGAMITWPAILAGAVVTAAISLIFVFLASALGLSAVSPWSNIGVSAGTFGFGAAVCLIFMQGAASGLGGYLTGRLRGKWLNMNPDEVFFRDTAHGFLSWSLATLVTAAFLASAVSGVVGTSAVVVSNTTDTQARGAIGHEYYFVDRLFRSDHMNSSEDNIRGEANSILLNAIATHSISENDKFYLAQLVALRTGLTPTYAAQRVRDVFAQIDASDLIVRQNADVARKSASSLALFMFLAMLTGAFVASIGAALGGHHRDKY